MRRALMVCGIAGVLALGAAACGGDDDDSGDGGEVSSEAQPYVDQLKETMTAGDSGDLVLTDEQADCLAPRFVNAIGVDTLEEAGIEPSDMGSDDSAMDDLQLSDEQGEQLASSFGECDISLKTLFIDSLVSENDLSDEDKACLEEEFPEDLLERLMVTAVTEGNEALQNDDSLMSEMFEVFAKCPGAAGS
jgi:hypothetical protein